MTGDAAGPGASAARGRPADPPDSWAERAAGEHTRAVHGPVPVPPGDRPFGLPVYRSAVFAFPTPDRYSDVLTDRSPGYVYSRIDNPTADAFAAAVAALEGHGYPGEVVGQPFASGMAAISTVLLTLCRAGQRVVAQRAVYGGTYGVLRHVLDRFGVESVFVDTTDEPALTGALADRPAVLWAETLANPTLEVADLPRLAGVAHRAGVPLVVDSTFATPAVCQPLAYGADLVVHSATKYIGGHSDATGGVVVGRPELVARIRHTRIDLGGALAPDEAFLLHRGLATLPLRVARHCNNAARLAEAMAGHPRVRRVLYPGLSEHRDHQLARRLFHPDRFGGVVTVVPDGDREAGRRCCRRLRLATNATSLGGPQTVVSHVASTTHRQLDDRALAAAGIEPAAVRVSVGLEDVADLVADFDRALADD